MKRSRRIIGSVGLLIPCLFMAGCLIPYAYPKLSYISDCNVADSPDTETYAFRVDVSLHRVDVSLHRFDAESREAKSTEEIPEFTIKPISLQSSGKIPSQVGLSVERGLWILGIVRNCNASWSHTTCVRLYRPGYDLVELRDWDSRTTIEWKPAADWSAQERAVDSLLRRPAITQSDAAEMAIERKWGEIVRHLPEATSQVNLDPIVFAAAEFERISALAPTPEDANRLREKAKRVIELNPLMPPYELKLQSP